GPSTGQCLKYQLVEMDCNPPWEQPFLGPKDCLAYKQTAVWLIKSTPVAAMVPKSVAGLRCSRFPEGVLMKNHDAAFSRDIQLICAKFSSIQVKTQADWMYVVPTGRVVVPTGRYVVPAGKVIIIVSPGRLSLVPTGRVLSPGSKDLSRVGSDKWDLTEGLHKGYDRMQKILSQLNQLKAKPEDDDINLNQSAGPSHSAFVSTTSAGKKMSYADSPSYSSYTAPSNSKTGSHRYGNAIEEGAAKIYNLINGADTKEASTAGDAGEFALMGVTSEEVGKKEEDSKALVTIDTLVDWTNNDGQSDGFITTKEFGMIAGCNTKDAIEEGAAKIYNLITGGDTKEVSTAGDAGEFALMG
ncbi:hypothetical protein Tco_1257646, partial [Tanacetum coccineum]